MCVFRSQSLRLPSQTGGSTTSVPSSPRNMVGYGNVEARIIETDYPVNDSLASLASNEESGQFYLTGNRLPNSQEHSTTEQRQTENGRLVM